MINDITAFMAYCLLCGKRKQRRGGREEVAGCPPLPRAVVRNGVRSLGTTSGYKPRGKTFKACARRCWESVASKETTNMGTDLGAGGTRYGVGGRGVVCDGLVLS